MHKVWVGSSEKERREGREREYIHLGSIPPSAWHVVKCKITLAISSILFCVYWLCRHHISGWAKSSSTQIHARVLTRSHRGLCFTYLLNIPSNDLSFGPKRTRPIHYTFLGCLALWGKAYKKEYYSGKQTLSLETNERHKGKHFRKGAAALSLSQVTSWTWLFPGASLLLHMLEHTMGWSRRKGAGYMQLVLIMQHCGFLFPRSLHRDNQEGSRWHQDHYGIMSLIEPSLEPP